MRNWLREIRKNKGYKSCREAAYAIGNISVSHYTNIENGLRNPHYELAQRIASVLNFDWRLFYENSDNSDNKGVG